MQTKDCVCRRRRAVHHEHCFIPVLDITVLDLLPHIQPPVVVQAAVLEQPAILDVDNSPLDLPY